MISTPKLIEINDQIKQDLKNKLGIDSDDDLKKVYEAISIVTAGQFRLQYLYLRDLLDNVFPDKADLEENGGTLERQGRIYLDRNPQPATSGIFRIRVTGESGSKLRAGLTFKSNDTALNPGRLYVLDNEYTMLTEEDFVEIRSLEGGSSNNLDLNNTLSITEPVIGVDKLVTVSSIVQESLDSEPIEDYRQSILNAIQLEPQGGARVDYVLWSDSVQGVRKVYPYTKDGQAGTVILYVEATEGDSIDGLGSASPQMLQNVYDAVNFNPDDTLPLNKRGRRPLQANIETVSVTPASVNLEISGLSVDSIEIRNKIEQNLRSYIKTVRPFLDGADLFRNKNDILTTSKLQGVVSNVIGTNNYFQGMTMSVNDGSFSSYLFQRDEIPFLNEINFS
tara:strand:- start:301 stop:1479 length:1179 start_codon:yes stop_codon:yes gene_type:complete